MGNRGPCIDLFCGAGGLSCGFKQAGFEVRLGVDLDRTALITFQNNHFGAKVLREDVRTLTGKRLREMVGNHEILGLLGGPPCQGFSLAGKRDPHDVRNQLPYEYARILKEVQPKFFLMENVKGMLSKKQRPHFDTIMELLQQAGFHLHWKLLNAWDYGVAQTRERIFIIGFRQDLKVEFQWPVLDPTRPVLRDVIGDLPDPLTNEAEVPNHHLTKLRTQSMENRLQKAGTGASLYDCRIMDWGKPSATITAHLAKDVDLAHPGSPPNHQGHLFQNVNLNWKYEQANRATDWDKPAKTVTAHYRAAGLHPNHGPVPREQEMILKMVSHANPQGVIPFEILQQVLPARANLIKGRQKIGVWEKPNPTITANMTLFAGAHFHPNTSKPRRFTVRECARIQSFPDFFVFYGSLSAQYRQVGNAVPPRMAYLLAMCIADALQKKKTNKNKAIGKME
ncbi:DNA cytosine methyltransferase [Effusibacillus consociatus]|uniref:DNA (cytosine-5-)-methyltransferase n=1 Tax=Effusibacillus consociatus TaxID=1117041 RepID=A0ABV9PY26_9BACL